MGIKGQKVNPVGWRLNVNRNWKDSWFNNIQNYKSFYLNKLRLIKLISSLFLINKGVLVVDIKLFKQSLNNFIILCFYYKIRKDKKDYYKIKQLKNNHINYKYDYNYDNFLNKTKKHTLQFKILKNLNLKKFKKFKINLNLLNSFNLKKQNSNFLLKKQNHYFNKTTSDFFKKRKKWLNRRFFRKYFWKIKRNETLIKKKNLYVKRFFKWKLKKWVMKRSLFIINKENKQIIQYLYNNKIIKNININKQYFNIFNILLNTNKLKKNFKYNKILLYFLLKIKNINLNIILVYLKKILNIKLNINNYFIKVLYNYYTNNYKKVNKISNNNNIYINKLKNINNYFNLIYTNKVKSLNIKNFSKKKLLNVLKSSKNNFLMFNIVSLLNFSSIYRLYNKNILKSSLYKNIWKQQNRLVNQNFFKKRLINLYDFVLLTYYSMKFLNLNLCCKILTQHIIYLWIFFKSKSKRLVPVFFRYVKLILRIRLLSKNIETLKIQFKGRFDRWKRARSLVILTGSLPLQSYNTFIDFGSYSGLTKNGSFGLRIWTLINKNITEFSNYQNVKNYLYYSL